MGGEDARGFSRWEGTLLDPLPVTSVVVGFSLHTKRGFQSGIPLSMYTFPKDGSTGKASRGLWI